MSIHEGLGLHDDISSARLAEEPPQKEVPVGTYVTNRLCEVSGDGRDRPPRDDLVGHYSLGDGRGASSGLIGQAAHDPAHLVRNREEAKSNFGQCRQETAICRQWGEDVLQPGVEICSEQVKYTRASKGKGTTSVVEQVGGPMTETFASCAAPCEGSGRVQATK